MAATRSVIGILHPGAMGVSVAASAVKSGHTVYWASEGRSRATRERAEDHGLTDASSVAELCRLSSIIISVCPPHAAEWVASEVASHGFRGVYLDANAVSPERARRIAQIIEAAGGSFVDGGIIGGPAWKPGMTWLYLSGPEAQTLASLFSEGPLETQVLSEEVGQASALKMCYAAYSKGTTALLTAILAAAQVTGVGEALAEQWERDEAGFSERTQERARRVTAKAWRFEGEMGEIADTFEGVGLPGGFHQAAAELYGRLALFKEAPDLPNLVEVTAALLAPASSKSR